MRGDDEYKMRNLTFSEQEWKQQQYQDHIQQNLTCGGNAKQKIRIFTMKERPSSRGYGTQKIKECLLKRNWLKFHHALLQFKRMNFY